MSQAHTGHRIISDAHFVESIRDFGLTTMDAVKELVDNSFDANAENIWISVGKNDNSEMYLIVEDDGDGIPRDELANALSFGGQLPWREDTTGKYGFGLPSSACCQTSRAEVYTRTEDNSEYFSHNYIDIGELKEEGRLPNTGTQTSLPEKFDFSLNDNIEQGTIMIFKNLTRPQYSTVRGMKRNIQAEIAEFHRKFLAEDRTVSVNGDEIQFADPLMMMDGSEAVEECGSAEQYGKIEPIEFSNAGPDGETQTVEITLSKLPIRKIMEQGLGDKYRINQSKQGFYLIRNDRQIAGGQSLQLYTKTSKHNFFRAEIEFSPSLDGEFGVQTNKSRFSLAPDLRSKLEDRLEGVISSIGDEIAKERSDINAELQQQKKGTVTISEEIANDAVGRLRPSPYTPSKSEIEEQKEGIEDTIGEIEEDDSLTANEKEERIENLRRRFKRDKIIVREIEPLSSGHFYEMAHKGKQLDVTINQGHEFYRKVYSRAQDDPELQVYLDLIIFALAQAEDQYYTSDDVRKFYDQQRTEWSTIMRQFLLETESRFD